MSDEQAQAAPSGKKGSMIMLVVILLVEAVVIVGAMKFFGPGDSAADEPLGVVGVPEEEKITEMLILDARLPNARQGVEFVYPTEVYAQVKARHTDRVVVELEQFQNEIRAELTAIWKTSEPRHFREPRLETLTRKVESLLTERFGLDPESGEPIVVKAVVVMGTGFRVDA